MLIGAHNSNFQEVKHCSFSCFDQVSPVIQILKCHFKTEVNIFCASVRVSDLLVRIPPAALSRGFGRRVQVVSGQRFELDSTQRVWKDSFWKDLHFGLSDAEKRER